MIGPDNYLKNPRVHLASASKSILVAMFTIHIPVADRIFFFLGSILRQAMLQIYAKLMLYRLISPCTFSYLLLINFPRGLYKKEVLLKCLFGAVHKLR